MFLSDKTIKASKLVVPLKSENVSPVSVDLTLAGEGLSEDHHAIMFNELEITPGEFLLLSTNETVRIPNGIAAIVKGKSSLARQGLMVECAGFVDPGFTGTITLEVKNLNRRRKLVLKKGQKICQIVFMTAEPSEALYSDENGHHYQGQNTVTKSVLDK